MAFKRRGFLKAGVAVTAGAAAGFPHIWIKNADLAYAANGELKVGVLFSLTGTIAIIGASLNHATLLAIEEINDTGGVNGMKIRPVIEDPASDPATFAQKARKLVIGDKCISTFGSYTSASRKAVLPVFERYNNLYWYPTLYEGQECSQNCIYTGAVPNQQQKDFIPWLLKKYGKRFYLIGSNYVYPKVENNACKILLKELGGEVVGEEYVPLGQSEFSSVIQHFKNTKPDVIFSTVVGDSVVALMRQYKTAGFDPYKLPMASLTTSEEEVAAAGGEFSAGHLTSAPYFMSYDSPANHKFVEAYQKRWGAKQLTNFVSEAAYFQVYLFKKAVEKLHGSDITPPNIRKAAWDTTYQAPQGLVKVDPQNSNTYLWPKIGEVQPNGQFKILEETKTWVEPLPYWPLKGEVCTPTGLKKS